MGRKEKINFTFPESGIYGAFEKAPESRQNVIYWQQQKH